MVSATTNSESNSLIFHWMMVVHIDAQPWFNKMFWGDSEYMKSKEASELTCIQIFNLLHILQNVYAVYFKDFRI